MTKAIGWETEADQRDVASWTPTLKEHAPTLSPELVNAEYAAKYGSIRQDETLLIEQGSRVEYDLYFESGHPYFPAPDRRMREIVSRAKLAENLSHIHAGGSFATVPHPSGK